MNIKDGQNINDYLNKIKWSDEKSQVYTVEIEYSNDSYLIQFIREKRK